ncbi:hypothetical protein MPDQ_005776 [Monascus purpureus]|uniref:Urease accessory protein UreD n=1 Tax=Monascus purpureus TaxID=5098 RepID=A0A507QW50_MONPU|nr:hypothetical protein MPDQ_005776 [Monascus purpureus]BDD55205.1 hypothetical protein MAP00_000751 [Monascus purpureus]
MPLKSPFESSIAKPGQGKVVLSLLSPSLPTLTTLTYKYPLKLVSRSPAFLPELSVLRDASRPVHLHLLSYGGGLLPGDVIDVSIKLEPRTRLVVTTPQGSTKIYKTKHTSAGGGNSVPDKSKQILHVQIESEAALCYLPDPSAPFRDSRYEQIQTFTINRGCRTPKDSKKHGEITDCEQRSSLCVLDWVTQGRSSLGENWDFHLWRGKNEVWTTDDTGKRKLLLRDSLILDDESGTSESGERGRRQTSLIRDRIHPHGIVGTLILYGPVFDNLCSFIMNRFTTQPRIGARNWSSTVSPAASCGNSNAEDITWTAARVRGGFVIMKFGAKDFEAARKWLGALFREEGSVAREFGEEALLCL